MIKEIGGEVGRGILSLAGGVYIVFPIILALVFFLIFSRLSSHPYQESTREEKLSPLFLWIIIIFYCGLFGTMSILKYSSFHTTFFDLGIYDNAIWNIAQGDLSYLIGAHFRPIMGVYALFYKLFPSAITLLLLQTLAIGISAVPLYYIARKKLRSSYCALLVVVIYFLYSPVQYNNLINFHADHLIILLMFLAFYFLEKNKPLAFFLVCLPALFLKESLILSVGAMGLYAIVRYRMYKYGGILFASAAILFYFIMSEGMLYLGRDSYTGVVLLKDAFSYLGNNPSEAARNLVLHPWIVIREIAEVWKMGYLTFLFLPLLFIPLLSPLSLLAAFPALAISLLSRLPNHYWIQHQYTASVIAPVFVALINGLRRFSAKERYLAWLKKYLRFGVSQKQLLKVSLLSILIVSLYYNVVLSPSPISVLFWKKLMVNYYKTAYVITERDRVLDDAIRRFIPQDSSVVSQNMVNNSYLAHRKEYYCFPQQIEKADYVVLDQKRPHHVSGEVDEEEYEKEFNKVLKSHQVLFSYDGIYIFKRIQ